MSDTICDPALTQVPKPRRKARPPARKMRTFRSWLVRAFLKLGVVMVLVWSVVALGYYAWALTFDLKTIHAIPQRSEVYDREGKLYSRLAGENRVVVPFDKVSNDFVNALLAREDTRFYRHHGIDPIGILRALVRNFVAGGFREGASTITQQLARNSFPLGGRNLHRKLIEAALAYRIETELTKEEILEAYMNRIYFGSGYYGVETASRAYFGKPASRMSLPEAAMLAGLIRSPNRFSPFNNPEGSLRERNTVLDRMAEVGFITDAQRDAAKKSRPDIPAKPLSAPQENWAMDAVLRELDLVIDREQFDGGGLKIFTTIDGPLQSVAEASVRTRIAEFEALPGYPHRPASDYAGRDFSGEAGSPYLQAAAIAIDNTTGGIRAIVGGRDYGRSKFHRALFGRRPIGSAVKPFVFAKAIEAGLRPETRIDDSRLGPGDIPRAYGNYSPANADGKYNGPLEAREALIQSRNTMTVRIGMRTGLDAIAETVIRSGLSSDPPRFPALCLGAFESTLKDLTAAYTVFATGGVKLQPFLIAHITDADGRTIYKATRGRINVLNARAAEITAEVMEDVLKRGTASGARRLGLRHRAAGKTGTTNEAQDAWFVGFDKGLTCGVWVGFDTPRPIGAGGSGAALALPIWVDIIQAQ